MKESGWKRQIFCLDLGRNGGMDPCGSPYIIPNNSLHNPFPHSLPRTRQSFPAAVLMIMRRGHTEQEQQQFEEQEEEDDAGGGC